MTLTATTTATLKDLQADATPVSQSSDPDRVVPTRRVSFEESLADLPKYFAAGDLLHSHVLATLSSLFPDGEDFFVRSVRHYRDQITDPALRRQVNGFIGQEAVHGREHRVLNDRLAQLGYPTKQIAKLTKRDLEKFTETGEPEVNLAITAGLEHFTATLAELPMSSPEVRTMLGHAAVRDLLLWHALEESEHKAVAFDVYRAIGGSEEVRVTVMKKLRIRFALGVTLWTVRSLLTDRGTYRRGELRRSIAVLRRSPLLRREVWDLLRDYDRPDFHPSDRDTTALEQRWRDELFGPSGRVTASEG